MRLGILGGTFNPIHLGHLVLAETARDQLSLDRVLFIPTFQPPHKSAQGLLPGRIRLALIKRAISDHPAFAASHLELRRGGTSYSIETVHALRKRFPRAKLFLVMGTDMLTVRWWAWDQLTRLCTIVVAKRPGMVRFRRRAGVKLLPMPRLDISSSQIRQRLRSGRSIRYLVPPSVERYIRQHRLYHHTGH